MLTETKPPATSEALHLLCINTIRTLAMDAVEKAGSGHPGAPMGAAAMAFVLWTEFLKHNPANPAWPDRDRFVLSAGHASMLLYSLLHLTGYEVSTNKTPTDAYRAPGGTQAFFTLEAALEELAAKLEMDPLELRLKNAKREGEKLRAEIAELTAILESETALRDLVSAELADVADTAIAQVAEEIGERPGMRQMGQVMKAATAIAAGTADGARLSAAVKDRL